MSLTDNHKKIIKRIANIVSIVAIVVVGVMLEHKISTYFTERDTQKASVSCPQLYSIARSPRDTLLVMRSENLCVNYLLETME
jgi:hypothetical protein